MTPQQARPHTSASMGRLSTTSSTTVKGRVSPFDGARPATVQKDQLWRQTARRKLELQDKEHMLMTVLDATADAILCRPHSPSLGGSALETNSTGALEIFVDHGGVVPFAPHDRAAESLPAQRLPEQEVSWAARAEARSVGVKALRSLAARHTQTVKEKAECEAIALEALTAQRQLQASVVALEDRRSKLASEFTSVQAKLREAAQREKDKDAQNARAIDLINQSKAQEKRGLMVEIDKYKNANALSKMSQLSAEQQLLALEDDRAELHSRLQLLERHNTQLLAQAAAADSSLKEMERERQMMNENFELAREKLQSVKTFIHDMEQERASEARELHAKIGILENIFREEAALRQAAEAELKQVGDRL